MSTSPDFTPRVTRYTIPIWERGSWGREELHVLECRGATYSDPVFWAIATRLDFYWHPALAAFTLPRGEDQWAEVSFATAEEALAEAPRAAAHVLAQAAPRLAHYDAANQPQPAPSAQINLPFSVRTP